MQRLLPFLPLSVLLLAEAPRAAAQAGAPLKIAGTAARWAPGFGNRAPSGLVDQVLDFGDALGARLAFVETTYSMLSQPAVSVNIADPRRGDVATFYLAAPCCDERAYVNALLSYDDGVGPLLLVGGSFVAVSPQFFGGTTGAVAADLAVFDGHDWSAWPGGAPTNTLMVHALAANGPELYVATSSYFYSGIQAWRWTGSAWEALGATLPNLVTLAYSTAGGTGALYATSSSAQRFQVLRFENGAWTAVTSPLTDPLRLTPYDAGVPLLLANSQNDPLMAYDGTSWTILGGGPTPIGLLSLSTLPAEGADLLYACGSFDTIGTTPVRHVAVWDGRSWQEVGGGVDAAASSVAVDPSSGDVTLAGAFTAAGTDDLCTPRLARWDGTHWHALHNWNGLVNYGPNLFPSYGGLAYVLEELDLGNGFELVIGGSFSYAGASPRPGVAVWRGERWVPLGDGLQGYVYALATFDDGNGPVLYAGGFLDPLQSSPLYLARLDGSTWQVIPGTDGVVFALASFDDGSTSALYAAGSFTRIDGVPAYHLARFDGNAWSALPGAPVDGFVDALTVFDDGTGPALYAGGDFSTIGGESATGVARWNGTSWSALGSGFQVVPSFQAVQALDVVEVPALGGRRLVAGGSFLRSGSGVSLNGVAVWGEGSWNPIGSGFTQITSVGGFAAFDEGNGPELVAGGAFGIPGTTSTNLARFDGASWQPIPGFGAGRPYDLQVSDGSLWIGGAGFRINGSYSLGIARRFPAGPSSAGSLQPHVLQGSTVVPRSTAGSR